MAWDNVTIEQCKADYPNEGLRSALLYGALGLVGYELLVHGTRGWWTRSSPAGWAAVGLFLGHALMGFDAANFHGACAKAYLALPVTE